MPIGSTEFGTLNENLRQMPDVKDELDTRLDRSFSQTDCPSMHESTEKHRYGRFVK